MHRRKAGRVFLLISLGTVGIITMMILFRAGLGSAPAPEDSDLRPPWTLIPAESNAYTYFARAGDICFEPTAADTNYSRMMFEDIWHESTALTVIERNAETYDLFDRGLACEQWQDPSCTNLWATDRWLWLPGIRSGVRAMTIRADWLARHDRCTEAVDQNLKTIRVGHLLFSSDSSLVAPVVGRIFMSIGAAEIRDCLGGRLTASQLTNLAAALAAYSPDPMQLTNALKREYAQNIEWVGRLESGDESFENLFQYGPLPGDAALWRSSLDEGATAQMFADTCRQLVTNPPRFYSELPTNAIPPSPVPSRMDLLFERNAAGRALHDRIFVAMINRALTQTIRLNYEIAATRLIAAARAYRLDHNDLPDTLEDLVPDYISDVPVDAYDGQPIRYSKTKKIIYSVGTDGIDSGGVTNLYGGPRWEAIDFVFSLNF